MKKKRHLSTAYANTQLLSATSTIDYFFSDIESKLLFLKNNIRIQKFADSQFDSVELKRDTLLSLKEMVSLSGNVLQAYILDVHGNEVLHADNSQLDSRLAI